MKSYRAALCLLTLLTSFSSADRVRANPLGESVAAGNATFNRATPGNLIVNQTSTRAIINWSDFSIGAGELTKFIQPSATAAVLNRVVGGNPSQIYGTLQGNGQVYVINPSGILVGPRGQINTRGFLASTLDARNADFMAGADLKLSGNSTAPVNNQGAIEALGGDVFLIAHTVENSGSIHAAEGVAGLAAGSEVLLKPAGNERLSVLAGNPNAARADIGVNNVGDVRATAIELQAAGGNIYALAINNGGILRADSVVNENGRIVLRAGGGNIQNSGTLAAHNADGSGGSIVMDGGHNADNPATVVNSGALEARGDAAGSKGGQISVLGDHVGLFGEAVVDVSGDAGGGTVLIGGDYQGKNPAIQNAQAAFVSPDAQIKADALTLGNGGKVVVWSEASTRFYGSISARGGAQGGNGGSVETSGHFLDFHGTVSTLAPLGVVGRLLLDPTDLTIDNNPDLNVTAATPFVPTASPSHLSWGTIDTALGGGAVTVTTVGSPNSGVEVGDITIATASPALNRNNKLTLSAAGAITVNSGSTIMNSGTGDLELDAVGPVTINAGITLKGNLSVSGAGISSSAALVVNGALKTATFAAGSGNDITLGNGANDFTTVAITSGRNVTLNDINKIDLGASTISGTLGVTAAGAITQSGALAVTSVASFTAGANGITLSDAGNNFAGPVTVNNTGANDVVLRNAGDLTVGGSVGRNLMVTAGGSISDTSGALIVAGNSTFTLTAANTDVLLDTQPNSLGGVTTIALSGGSLLDLGLRNISGSASYPTLPPASPMNNLNLIFDTSGVTFPTPITLAGNLSVTAGMGVTLPTAITLGGNLSVTAGMPTTLRGTYSASTFNVVNAAVLSADTTISAGTIAFGGTVNGGHNLVANSAGATTFGGVVGGTTALTSLTSDAAGTVSLVGAKTSGAQNYQDGTVTLSGTYAASTFNVPNAAVLAGDTTVGATTTIGFGGTVDGAHNLAANSAGATSFGGLVGSATPLTSLTTDAVGTAALVGATTTGAQNYQDTTVTLSGTYSALTFNVLNAAALVGDTTVDAGTIGFGGTVNGAHNLTANSPGTTTFGGLVGNTTRLVSLTTDAAGSTALNGGSVKTSSTQTYNDDLTLGADTILDSTGAGALGDITLAKNVDGAQTLAVNTAGATTFGGLVGNGTRLVSVTTDAVGSTALNGGSVKTSGVQTYNDDVTLGADVVLDSAGAGALGNVTLAKTVNGAQALTVNTAGATTFNGVVGGTTPLASLTTDAGGTASLVGATTIGAQNYQDTTVTLSGPYSAFTFNVANAAMLAADTTVGAGTIGFGGTVNGAHNLAANSAGATTFGGLVGGTTPLTTLTTDPGGTASLVGARTTGAQNYQDTTVTLNGTYAASTFDVVNATVLAGDTTVGVGAGTIGFGGTVDGAHNLAVNSSGATAFGGVVGGTTPLTSLTTDAAGTTTLQGDVNANQVDFKDAVTLAGNVTLQNDTSGAAAASVEFEKTVDADAAANNRTLTVNATTTKFDAAVGQGQALASLTTDAAGTTTLKGNVNATQVDFKDAVILTANVTVQNDASGTAAASVEFEQTVDADAAANNRTLTVNATTTKFDAAVGQSQALASLTTDAAGTTTLQGNVNAKQMNFMDAVAQAADVHLTGSTLALGPSWDAVGHDLTLSFSSAVTVPAVFANVKNFTSDGSGGTTVSGDFMTSGSQTYGNAVTLSATAVLSDIASGKIWFKDKVDAAVAGVQGLTVQTDGTTEFDAPVGATALSALDVKGNSFATAGNTDLNAPTVKTTAGQTYENAVTLSATAVLADTGSGNIWFKSTVDAAAAGVQGLTVNTAGTTEFDASVGGTAALASLTTDLGGTASLMGATTTGPQNYQDGTVTLSGSYSASTFNVPNVAALVGDTTVGAGTISFGGTVDGGYNLAANSAGATTFAGIVGGTTPLASLTTDLGGTASLVGATTTGAQNYQDTTVTLSGTYSALTFNVLNAAALVGDTTVDAGTIGFGGTVNGAHNLTANSPGTTTFGGLVGNTTRLVSLTTDAAGSTALNGGSVKTSSTQTYNDDLTLGADTILDSTGAGALGDITLAKNVDGAQTLAVNTAGATTFGGLVGNGTRLVSVTTDAAGSTALNGGSVKTSGVQTYNDDVTLGADVVLDSAGAGALGNVTLAKTVNGAQALTVNTAGATTFNGVVGGTTPLASLTTVTGTLSVNKDIDVILAGFVTINNSGAVTGPGTVTAGTLNLSGNGDVGLGVLPSQRFNTAVMTIVFNKGGGNSYLAASGSVNVHGSITGGGSLDLRADSLAFGLPFAAATTILQPMTTGRPIDLGAGPSTSLVISESSLNNITAGLLRIGSATYTGNIAVRDNIILGSLTGTDLRTLSLKTLGNVSQDDGVKIEVANLSVEAATVNLNPASVCNNVNVLAAKFSGSFSYKDADSILTLADSKHKVDGIYWQPPFPLPPGASVSVTENCGTIQVASLNQDLASISYVNIPIPRLSLSEIELGGNIDTAEVKNRFGNNSIITFYLEVPFPKKRFNLSQLKLEEQSKWVGGHLAILGATSGPQGSQ